MEEGGKCQCESGVKIKLGASYLIYYGVYYKYSFKDFQGYQFAFIRGFSWEQVYCPLQQEVNVFVTKYVGWFIKVNVLGVNSGQVLRYYYILNALYIMLTKCECSNED